VASRSKYESPKSGSKCQIVVFRNDLVSDFKYDFVEDAGRAWLLDIQCRGPQYQA